MNQHDSSSRGEPNLDATFRRVSLPEPPTALRVRTLADVRDVLASNDRPAPHSSWRFAVAGVALALCLWSMSWRGPVPVDRVPINHALRPTPMARDAVALAQWLDLDPHLARHLRARLNRPRPSRPHASTRQSEGSRFHGQLAVNAEHL